KPVLRHLETLQIFGVQANYMEQFKKFLEEEGLPANDSNWISIQIPVLKKPVVEDKKLQLIRVKDDMSFRRNVLFEVDLSLSRFDGKRIVLDWYPKIDVLQKQRPGVQLQKEEQFLVDAHLELLDWNKMYLEIQAYKDDKGFHNMRLTPESLKKILNNNSWYKILIPSSKFRLNDFQNTFIWQELAETLLKKYIEHYYLFERNEHNAGHVEAIFLDGADENFIFEYDFRLNSEEDIDQYQEKIEQLKQEVAQDAFSSIQIAQNATAFDNMLHLYKPLVYLGRNYENLIKVSPIALDASERQFLDDLLTYVQTNPKELDGKEVHI